MESISGVKAAPAAHDAAYRKHEEPPAPARSVNGVELRADAAVPPVQPSERLRPAAEQRQPANGQESTGDASGGAGSGPSRTVRNIEFDAETRTVLFQSISARTGEVVTQIPTELQLRVREYARSLGEDAAVRRPGRDSDRSA